LLGGVLLGNRQAAPCKSSETDKAKQWWAHEGSSVSGSNNPARGPVLRLCNVTVEEAWRPPPALPDFYLAHAQKGCVAKLELK
jgi:hypothetical protein